LAAFRDFRKKQEKQKYSLNNAWLVVYYINSSNLPDS